MIKVSVIIPIYNVEKYLEECLESVTNQTLKDIQIICINDGSTDKSSNILKRYAEIDSRIEIINNSKNYGQSYSRNRGLEFAQGEYIYFLDSDDKITDNAMEELYETAKVDNLDAVFFDATLIFENELLKKKFIGYKSERKKDYLGIFKGQDLFTRFIQNDDWISSPPRQFWRREYLLHNDFKFYEGIIHEDELFAFLALMKARRVKCLNKKYFMRRFRENSTMTTRLSKKNFEGIFICYAEMLSFWQNSNFSKDVDVAIDSHISRFYRRAKSIYKKICDQEDMLNLDKGNIIVKHLYKLFISNMQERIICKNIDERTVKIIKEYKNVIIYGAGIVGRDVLHILDRNEIGIYGFAVTDKIGNPKYIMGLPVYSIDELVELREDAVVLVAVLPKHQDDILKKLEEFEFKNIIKVL